jgi:hypothetical protein
MVVAMVIFVFVEWELDGSCNGYLCFCGGDTCVMLELMVLMGSGMESTAMWSGKYWDLSHAVL